MKVLTPEHMREVDRLTIEAGIPGLVLMENAACRFVEFLAERFSPLSDQRIAIICGKGNNGGDGLAIARQLLVRFNPRILQVFLIADILEMSADSVANYTMWVAAGGEFAYHDPDPTATIVIDALLGTGIHSPVSGHYLDWIRKMNTGFPLARVIAVDTPSGLIEGGEYVRAHHTVTFAAPKLNMVSAPLHEAVGELIVGKIGALDRLIDESPISLSEVSDFAAILAPRSPNTHKGSYGHVMVAGGSAGKTGAALMTGVAALRAGAGLVTVATSAPESVAAVHPELMSATLNPDEDELFNERTSVLAIGPGLGLDSAIVAMVRRHVRSAPIPVIVDADGLNALAGMDDAPWPEDAPPRIVTPHPGEMSRLIEMTGDRVQDACTLAMRWNCCVVLKGARSVIAFPDGNVWINPTGSAALAKAGAGDILTGVIAGLVAQFPENWQLAVRCAVFLHGRAGDLAAKDLGEKGVLATDMLRYLYAGL